MGDLRTWLIILGVFVIAVLIIPVVVMIIVSAVKSNKTGGNIASDKSNTGVASPMKQKKQ